MAKRNPSSSSRRLGVGLAPGGLCLVQDLVNTEAIPAFDVPDLLADSVVGQRWLTESMRTWSERTGQPRCELSLGERDLGPLRRVRADLRHWLMSGDLGGLTVPAKAVTVGVEAGRPVYQPRGEGASGLTAVVGMEILLASRAATLDRLKVCMNSECSAVFYDLSRNSSRVWHDVKTCGNVVNLRASRARRRDASVQAGPTPPQ